MGPHGEFLELCALLTINALSAEEEKKLREHLAACGECREALKQFEEVVDRAIPAVAPELAGELPSEDPSFSQDAAERAFFKRLSEDEKSRQRHEESEPWLSPLAVRRSRSFRKRFGGYRLWLPLAAACLLGTSLGILTYRLGERRGVDTVRLEQNNQSPIGGNQDEALAAAMRERDEADAELAARDEAIAKLEREIEERTKENAKLTASESERLAALETSAKDNTQLISERDRLLKEAEERKAALDASQQRLQWLEHDRTGDELRAASLEAQVADLSRELKAQQRTTSEQEELLAKDRDIRELMGARDLYVAEVHDVARTGATEKVFGRVFYTKGKSLIFYAYDLNEQPGLKDASTFRAWGRRGPDWTQALKLGDFHEDNVSKKRWVVKFNDKKSMDQIDAVFVTVEPRGGSEKPTGKPLLFAYLKVAPNHP